MSSLRALALALLVFPMSLATHEVMHLAVYSALGYSSALVVTQWSVGVGGAHIFGLHAAPAVGALVENGANPLLMNKSGSTPLHLAVQNTGRSDSGSDAAKEGQARIIALLLEHGASPIDTDANGKTVAAAASSDWTRNLLGIP